MRQTEYSQKERTLQLGKSNNIDQPGYNRILLHEKNMAQEEKHPPPLYIYIFEPNISHYIQLQNFQTQKSYVKSPVKTRRSLNKKNADRYKPTRTFPSLHDD